MTSYFLQKGVVKGPENSNENLTNKDWILTSIEWRLNELLKEMRENNERIVETLSILTKK